MSQTFTVITSQEPDPVAMAWAISQVNPDYWVTVDDEAQVWRVDAPGLDMPLMVIETPSYVQVPDEALRLFGTYGGLNMQGLYEATGSAATYWQDVHAISPIPESVSAAATLVKLMAHLGMGTCIQHGPTFHHLGESEEDLREEWKP